jgi:hypothetical protein
MVFRPNQEPIGRSVYCAAVAAQYKNIPLFNIIAAPKVLSAQGIWSFLELTPSATSYISIQYIFISEILIRISTPLAHIPLLV